MVVEYTSADRRVQNGVAELLSLSRADAKKASKARATSCGSFT